MLIKLRHQGLVISVWSEPENMGRRLGGIIRCLSLSLLSIEINYHMSQVLECEFYLNILKVVEVMDIETMPE